MDHAMSLRRRLFTHRGILTMICLVCTAGVLALHLHSPAFQSLELGARDWLMTNPSARRALQRSDIVYLGIDQASRTLDTLFDDDIEKSPTLKLMKAAFPWNRGVYAALIDRLVGAGAKVVALDLVFPNEREGDAELKAALDRHAAHVVIGSNLATRDEYIAGDIGQRQSRPSYEAPTPQLIPPIKPLDDRVGFVNIYPDPDGKIRSAHFRTTLLEYFGKAAPKDAEELYSFAARVLQKAGHPELVPKTRDAVPLRFSADPLPRSLHEVFVDAQWEAPPYNSGAFFKDKIVIVGAAGNTGDDRLQTPFGATIGPAIHISAINAALLRDFLRDTSRWENIALVVLSGFCAWLIGFAVRKPLVRLGVLVATIGGGYLAIQGLFNWQGYQPLILSPLLALGGSGFTWAVWEQVLDLRDKARLRRTFERYVSRDVVKELVENPAGWLNTVGGARKNVTVLFSDVRGFTTLTEAAEDPHALVTQLNEYFDEMVAIVFRNNGTLDKFIGDAVMAHWGSITSEGEAIDAQRAVATAVEMRETLARLNVGWKKRGMLELHFGIGVNHGEAIVGNLGCEAKMEFSMIGDAVNLASRLEGVTKTYALDLCIGEKVAPLVRDEFVIRSLDLIIVKGKTKPVEIFAVLGRRMPFTDEPEWLAVHEKAMQLYRTGDFSAAEAAWTEVLQAVPDDPISRIFLERCGDLRAEPPEGEWKGVFEMKSK